MITVVGANGFVGKHLVFELERQNLEFQILKKDSVSKGQIELGTLVYCSGNGDCAKTPLNVLDANTTYLSQLLKQHRISKIIYLSSTRLYMGSEDSEEESDLQVLSLDERKLFNVSKIVSEELLRCGTTPYVILRPSNIYGDAFESPLFLPSIVRDALIYKTILMYISPSYSKDYVSVFDLVDVIIMSALNDQIVNRTINVASGRNITAQQIADTISLETGCSVLWKGSSSDDYFPETDITAMKDIFSIEPRNVLDDLPVMISSFKRKLVDA
ncbi:SDR family oxidoreductase [Alteromonas sp. W364]|uniref:NAD-dependent epimerase/dehydratase family protein n=1 Tax=Alteromonas sp. W364 TaxID=3075610 RepID=UPI002885C411|nr:SDR family oxidoreductase [Alteromonas sp. W364]MDT0627736.1 SDR family oxidoreductase [Alteromonas sp. W364]